MSWTQYPKQDFQKDDRGWEKGKRRKWDKTTEKQIKKIHKYLTANSKIFFTGATAVEQEWREKYPLTSPPPLRTIGQILLDLGLSEKRKKGRNKGAARYLCYPEHTIYNLLKGRILESDFVGKKYITGRSEPLNFIGFSFKKEPKIRYFKRIEGQTADNFINYCEYFFNKFEKPDFVKVDNGLAVIGSASVKRNVSSAMLYLLKNKVIPIFAVPRKPFSQASIEGNNSVFSRKFWNKINFKNIKEVDKKLEWFNDASVKYLGYRPPKTKRETNKKFIPKVYFIRQGHEDEKTKRCFVEILNDKIFLRKSYINYFVLGEWNLKNEELKIYFEKDLKPKVIKKIKFKINPISKIKCKELF